MSMYMYICMYAYTCIYICMYVHIHQVGDIRLTLYDHDAKPPQDEVACFLCFHTGFVAQAETVFAKDAIDI